MTVGCSLRHVWEQVRDDTITTLSSKTFADLASTAGGRWASIQGPARPQPRA